MSDTVDTNKIVTAILAAAQVSQTGDKSTGRYLDAYAEMSKAMRQREEQKNAAWIEAFRAVPDHFATRSGLSGW